MASTQRKLGTLGVRRLGIYDGEISTDLDYIELGGPPLHRKAICWVEVLFEIFIGQCLDYVSHDFLSIACCRLLTVS
jgi:hypothetical protein